MSGINRGNRYLNLFIFSDPDAGLYKSHPEAQGLLAIEDATEEMIAQQAIVQKKNEIALLTKQLEDRNAALETANSRLDSLMGIIRTHNHDLDLQVKLSTNKLYLSHLSVITTLARVAEFKDMDTGGHVYRIGRSSVLLAKHFGLAAKDCENLFYASLLHDVGKIGIPDAILLKKGSLTKDEWVVMQRHTIIGAEILDRKNHFLFESARDVALFHHERWDGNGYPAGLQGEKIPLYARICSIVDVFDALTSNRPYKESWSDERAVEVILQESGKAFDPSIVTAFLDVVQDIISLRLEASFDQELLPPELE